MRALSSEIRTFGITIAAHEGAFVWGNVLLLPFCVPSCFGAPSDTLNDSFTVQRSETATFETIGECLKRTLLDLRRQFADSGQNQSPETGEWLLLKLSFRRFCVLRVSPKRRLLFRRDLRRYLDHVLLLSQQVPVLGFCTASRSATPFICRGRRAPSFPRSPY